MPRIHDQRREPNRLGYIDSPLMVFITSICLQSVTVTLLMLITFNGEAEK